MFMDAFFLVPGKQSKIWKMLVCMLTQVQMLEHWMKAAGETQVHNRGSECNFTVAEYFWLNILQTFGFQCGNYLTLSSSTELNDLCHLKRPVPVFNRFTANWKSKQLGNPNHQLTQWVLQAEKTYVVLSHSITPLTPSLASIMIWEAKPSTSKMKNDRNERTIKSIFVVSRII